VLHDKTLQLMTEPLAKGDPSYGRSRGWDKRSGFSSNRGDLMTDQAYGHGGFTGNAFWIDPGLDIYVIFLSNRLHPDGVGNVNDLAGRIGTIAAAAAAAGR
jgi:CubicO group peptidase (beta-lactamase class C family)